jgi:hypothetical protein
MHIYAEKEDSFINVEVVHTVLQNPSDALQQEQTESTKEFKCFYWINFLNYNEHLNHIDAEHAGKLYYHTPADFESRLDQ